MGVTPRTGDAHKGLRYEVNRGEHSAPRNRGMHPARLPFRAPFYSRAGGCVNNGGKKAPGVAVCGHAPASPP